MSTDTAPMIFDQEEIATAGQGLPDGTYNAKLLDVQVSESPGKEPSLLAIFEITDGPKKGEDLRIYRFLGAYKTVKGGWFLPGMMEIKADLVAVGGLVPGEKLTREPSEARMQYAKGLARKEVEIKVYKEEYVKNGEKQSATKKRIIGIKGGPVAHTSEGLDLL